jgi:hypothetical protein
MNLGNEGRPTRKSLIGWLIDLAWRGSGRVWAYNRHWVTGTPLDRAGDEDLSSKEEGSLPGAELSEEERRRAVEEMRRKPRIG